MLLLVESLLVEDFVDLLASDLFDNGIDVPLMMSRFTCLCTFLRFTRTSLVPGLVFTIGGRCISVLMFLLGRLAV